MIRLLFLNRQFERGGAERQLIELLKGIDKSRFSIAVATFYEGGPLYQEIKDIADIQLLPLYKRHRWDILSFLWRLRRAVHAFRPQIIHGYMGVANQISLLMGRLFGAKVVWGMRASNMDLQHYDWLFRLSRRVECFLSRFVDLIVVNSEAGRDYHVSRGFPEERMLVIPNGIDIECFCPNANARAQIRNEWGISEAEVLIGLVGRFDPMKDHRNFLQAAALVLRDRDDVRFVCVGDGPTDYRHELHALANKLGIKDRLVWAGVRQDMPTVYNGIDIFTSSSAFGEGFPNVVGEAMSCGTPCVVTAVGDSGWIVGDTGLVVPPKAPEALAAGWNDMIERLRTERDSLSEKARSRIVDSFRRELLVERTSAALAALL